MQKLEPTIQGLIEKHKAELRKAEDSLAEQLRSMRTTLTDEFTVRE